MSEARMATPEDFNRELMRIPVEGICGEYTRDTLWDGIRHMSTPKDIPNVFSEMWDRSVVSRDQQLVVLPKEFRVTLGPVVDTAIRDSLLAHAGQTVTEAMVRRVIDDVTARMCEACGYPPANPKTTFESGHEPPVIVDAAGNFPENVGN